MEEIKKQVRDMYIILGALMIIGVLILIFVQKTWIAGYLLGGFISALTLLLSYVSFVKTYSTKEKAQILGVFGTMPKLLLLFGGALIAYNLPSIFNFMSYIIGFCMYLVTYLVISILNFFKYKKSAE